MPKTDRKKRIFLRSAAVLFLLLLWQAVSVWVDRKVFLPSPAETLTAAIGLVQTGAFWRTILTSTVRIMTGFLTAFPIGILLAALSRRNALLGEIIELMMLIIKSVPVASFVILVLLWVKSAELAAVISFLVACPVVYVNVRDGIRATDRELLEMAVVFRFSIWRKLRFIYLPQIMPAILTACSVSIGFCIKAGVAAEVIGLPSESIGESLYEAKLYLMTPELFAWTAVIVALSAGLEHLVKRVVGVWKK